MNNKTYSTQKKYNAKKNGELRQPKKHNKNIYRYNDDYDDAMEQLNSLSYIGNFKF